MELVRYALLMVLGARRPLTLVELASSVAAYRALSAGSNVMETIGGKELLERLYKAGCLKYIAASYRRVTFLSCDDVREAAHEYGLGKDMLKRRGKLAVAEASTFYISQQVKGMEWEEINHVAMSVASDVVKLRKTNGSRQHLCSSVRNFAIHASFLCYAAEHSASQLSEFPIHGAQNGSLKLRPSLQESQQQLWEPGNFCLRYWYHRLNMAPPSVRGSYVPYQAYSRANGPISDDFGTKFFIAAAELGYQAFITTGLEHPENRNETNQYGHNALHIACIHRDIAMVKILLVVVDVDMFARDNLGFTPFHLAAHLAEPELLQVLFDSARARFGPVELQRFRAMFQESRPGCRPSFTSGHTQLLRRFLSSRNDTAALSHWEAWTLCTCSHRYLFSATRMGSAMIYLACRRHPELMQALHGLGIDERQLQQR
ncbi:uncharacterized protein E0L32_007483 [Thyridium curvatum]|uniref:Ankyrin repeat protein n=1 Tax=Thyridium curvatum TaxID=1093900 RepID=A0A507AYA3_9PEZI|nr:uncharacterized protein E0L32_007483 [Thyridium curvatum]TPX11746.1 hypothetical protein E0L32_007483 [Thyridium curvatum]